MLVHQRLLHGEELIQNVSGYHNQTQEVWEFRNSGIPLKLDFFIIIIRMINKENMTEISEIEQQVDTVERLKKEVEDFLSTSAPREYLNSLSSLCKADLVVLGKVANPSPKVRLVGKAAAILLGIKPVKIPDPKEPVLRINDYWKPFQKLLSSSNSTVITSIVRFNIGRLDPKVVAKVEKECLSDPDFQPEIIANASLAAVGLAKWVIGIVSYYYYSVPLKQKQDALHEAEKRLEELQGQPAATDESITATTTTKTEDSSIVNNITTKSVETAPTSGAQESVFAFVPPSSTEPVKA